MTRVINITKEKCDVYIGRPSQFGNPYSLSCYTRDEAIARYKLWFESKLSDPVFREAVLELKGKALGCFCKPLNCHGDVIVDYLNAIADE